ncbi:hypothetical protein MAQ5080_01279 [Marinomonas aquimarina]|uniref:AbiV family abortive infection protein n=1 Tax=Marinomonas aquimarina TaxID=295068 RepID=A0A1A8TBT2_9GAMM|nr:AbiV family abortive infection protein [Marinomonas aquimarina]SBS29071.1 hypothetical protein MAQ5080_01279 [Marinomonas aquimarina]
MSKNLKQWKNTLSAKEICDGMNYAQENAIRLLHDAETLFDIGSYPTAHSLAILAIEEAGKVSILRGLAVARDGKDVKDSWKAYRTHTQKNVLYSFPFLVAQGHEKLSEFSELFSEANEMPALLDDLKQIGFYTDCLGEKHWSVPSQIIDHVAAANLLKVARILCTGRKYETKEIELWIKHMKPVWKSSMSDMKQAQKAWFSEMVDEGLTKEEAISFDEFIGGS